MRSGIIGGIVGAVIGIVVGATIIAPRLHPETPRVAAAPASPPPDVSRELPRLLLPRPDVELKMAGAVTGEMPLAGSLGPRFDTLIGEASRGQMEIQLYEPGVLVPSGDLFEAVASGAIDGGFAPAAMLGNDIAALQIFGGVPFGPNAAEFLAWIKFGGGRELLDKIAEAHGTRALVCGLLPEAAAGWFRKEIEVTADLRGVKMAIDGLGARVLQRLGVQTRPLDLSQVGAALASGAIDAVAFSGPALDLHAGLHNHLKHYYFPGWQQPTSALLLLVNLGKWQDLKSSQRVLIETVCGDNVSFSLAEGEAIQHAALQQLHAAGVQFRRWPSSIRDELQRSWAQIAEELASQDAEFRRVWSSLSAFRKQYGVWGELSGR
jgi:TRAP-type mannitol/chloroaromatic compound transport system substrate-binding protein